MKNYIGFVNDHSGSMASIALAACKDYNANIAAVRNAATTEMLDTVVSVVGVGYPNGEQVTRQVTVSNPHVLKPLTQWSCAGGTPLYDGIGNIIELFESLPDAQNPDVSFLIMVTTDGQEMHSRKYTASSLRALIERVSRDGRWTFAFRVPNGVSTYSIGSLGIPLGNIQAWDTTAQGMEKSTQIQTQAVTQYYAARSSGVRSSNAFYANASQVNTTQLEDISNKISLYVVPLEDNGIEIRPFILTKRMEYLKGSAFYQLTKTEARVQFDKLILVRDRNTGKVYAGKEARQMIGLPTDRNARLHPGDHKNYDLFIQSTSVNRKLVGGTGVIYWEEIGTPFTDADLAYLKPKVATPTPAVVQLPAVPVSTKPTPSPIAKTPPVDNYHYFITRESARNYCRSRGIPLTSIERDGRRWKVLK